jgi:hypothetical protein
LATLFEAVAPFEDAAERHWEPIPNWRLTILQRNLDSTHPPSLRQLIRATDLGGPDEAVAYAQARYFCMYLHTLGYLESVYRSVREDIEVDPTGERALVTALPDCTWSDLEKQFHDWVLSLHPCRDESQCDVSRCKKRRSDSSRERFIAQSPRPT